jgi:hypothetical protein
MVGAAPDCWDGKRLDSADHRSHVAYGSYGSWGYYKCPDTHPFVMPAFSLQAWFTVDINLGDWALSSDHMDPKAKPGQTFHADFVMAWDPTVHAIWERHCLDKMLNCSAGVLGNGQTIKGPWPPSWTASPRLIPVPKGPIK